MKFADWLCLLLAALVLLAAGLGIFYSSGGTPFTVENMYGEVVELYGDGIYRNDSTFKAGINKGTDAVMAIAALLLAAITLAAARTDRLRLLQCGLLAGLCYYAACLVFGVTFNQLFLLYVLLFSSALFALIFQLRELTRNERLQERITASARDGRRMTGTAVFLMVSGSSVLMWLAFILPAILQGEPPAEIQIYTTEPTYVLDLAIVLPVYYGSAIALLRRKPIGYRLTPVLLTFIIIIGAVVIGQSVFQQSLGIEIPLPQFVGLVLSFILLGIIALILNIRFLRRLQVVSSGFN